jgi:hypothetical protein
MQVLKILFGLFIALFLISGVCIVLLPLLGVTFGLVGAVIGFVWKLVTHPLVLIIFVALLAVGFFKKAKPQ